MSTLTRKVFFFCVYHTYQKIHNLSSLNCIFFRAFTSEIYYNCFFLLKFFANVRQICYRKRIYVSGRVFFKSQSGRRSRLIILSLPIRIFKKSKICVNVRKQLFDSLQNYPDLNGAAVFINNKGGP